LTGCATIWPGPPPSRGWGAGSFRRQQLRQPDQVTGGGGQGEGPADAGLAAVAGFPQSAAGLDPAERLLDALADPLADGVAGVSGGAPVDRRATVGDVLRHMRGVTLIARRRSMNAATS